LGTRELPFPPGKLREINDRDCAVGRDLVPLLGEDVHTFGRPESFFRWRAGKEAGAIISQVGLSFVRRKESKNSCC
jgi:hypothetical protein